MRHVALISLCGSVWVPVPHFKVSGGTFLGSEGPLNQTESWRSGSRGRPFGKAACFVEGHLSSDGVETITKETETVGGG